MLTDVEYTAKGKFKLPALKRRDDCLSFGVPLAIWQQHRDPPHGHALLRARRERPSSGGAANQPKELSSPHCLLRDPGELIVSGQCVGAEIVRRLESDARNGSDVRVVSAYWRITDVRRGAAWSAPLEPDRLSLVV